MKLVDRVVEIFNSKTEFAIAIAPEGTRQRVKKWKSGFYNIAKGAEVAIYLAGVNYERHEIVLKGPCFTTEDRSADMNSYIEFFSQHKGRHPELGVFEDTEY